MAIIMFSTSVTTPGTPQRLMANANPASPVISGMLSGAASLRATSITFQSAHGNTAGKYFYTGTVPTMNYTTKTAIGLEIATGQSQLAVYPAGAVALDDIYIDTDGVAGDKLYVTVAG